MKTLCTLIMVLTIQVMVKSQTVAGSEQLVLGGHNQKLNTINTNALTDLIKHAEGLYASVQMMKEEAKTMTGPERNKLYPEISKFYKQYEAKLIEVSELSAKISYEKFDLNKMTLSALMLSAKNISTIENANNLILEAENARKQALELREEAYAQLRNAAKLGTMNNAEEKEELALFKQTEAIYLLQKSQNPSYASAK